MDNSGNDNLSNNNNTDDDGIDQTAGGNQDNDGIDDSFNDNDLSINDSGNIDASSDSDFELTIGDIQLNATALGSQVSSVTFGNGGNGTNGTGGAANPVSGSIDGSGLDGNRGLFETNNNTSVGNFNANQQVNVGTVNN
jgi:hypothetical protein